MNHWHPIWSAETNVKCYSIRSANARLESTKKFKKLIQKQWKMLNTVDVWKRDVPNLDLSEIQTDENLDFRQESWTFFVCGLLSVNVGYFQNHVKLPESHLSSSIFVFILHFCLVQHKISKKSFSIFYYLVNMRSKGRR